MNMTDDERFGARLRAMEGETPEIGVDRAGVLTRGRRRRAVRATGVTAGAGVLAGIMAVGGTTWSGDAPEARVTSLPGGSEAGAAASAKATSDAVIDYERGVITTPAEAYRYSSHEAAIVQTAQDVFTVECLQDEGVDAEWLRPAPGWGEHDYIEFGIWRPEDLREHGYVWEDPTIDPETGDVYKTVDYDRQEARAVSCGARMVDAGLLLDDAPSQDEGTWAVPREPGIQPAYRTGAGRDVLREWAECMNENGVPVSDGEDPKEAPTVPDGVSTMSHDEQVRVGRIDLRCKEDLNTLERLVEVQAQEDLAWIARFNSHGNYLDRRRAAEEEILAQAEAYLADHDIEVPAGDGT